jgi:KDO2-lipid IV(A) lauroyltransferase
MKNPLRLPASLSDAGALFAFKTATTIFNAMPAAEAYKLSSQLVRLWLTLDRRHRQVIEKNLDLALQLEAGSPASIALQAEISQNLGYNLCELFLLQNSAYRRLFQKNLQITGLQHLTPILEKNSGAIIVGAHFGNWELAGFLSSVIQKPITGVAKPIKSKPRLYAAIEKTRQEVGLHTVDKLGSAGSLVRLLKKGGIVALLADQRARRRYSIWAPFFGHQVATIPSPAVLARLSGSPILPAFLSRIRPLHHRLVIEKPIVVPKTGDNREVIAEYTGRINEILENQIRRNPAQWFWPHDRWRKIKPLNSD